MSGCNDNIRIIIITDFYLKGNAYIIIIISTTQTQYFIENFPPSLYIIMHSIMRFIGDTLILLLPLYCFLPVEGIKRIVSVDPIQGNVVWWTNCGWCLHTERRHQSRPSDYCEVIIKNLFLPLMKAAALLSEEQQRNIFYLLLSVFFNVLRKTITSNKALFV